MKSDRRVNGFNVCFCIAPLLHSLWRESDIDVFGQPHYGYKNSYPEILPIEFIRHVLYRRHLKKKKFKNKTFAVYLYESIIFLLFLSPRFSLQTFSWHTAPLANHFELRSKRILLSETLGHSCKFIVYII